VTAWKKESGNFRKLQATGEREESWETVGRGTVNEKGKNRGGGKRQFNHEKKKRGWGLDNQ